VLRPEDTASTIAESNGRAGARVHARYYTVPYMKKRGSFERIEAIKKAIDDFAECEMGHREFFWSKGHSIGVICGTGVIRLDLWNGASFAGCSQSF
jgi:hypothetical protein